MSRWGPGSDDNELPEMEQAHQSGDGEIHQTPLERMEEVAKDRLIAIMEAQELIDSMNRELGRWQMTGVRLNEIGHVRHVVDWADRMRLMVTDPAVLSGEIVP